ncbi:hypothetical protein EVG20_g7884 [Dentipellis fragilis]|uniref:Uncharacterized protein n=1 Tax=Dentipellis fragilis TaxID=205917 RepID=A0A4Y9YA52_9AGAM|nr:hypothetical protein EVG20_g7884 [Dentipellis fragilis]
MPITPPLPVSSLSSSSLSSISSSSQHMSLGALALHIRDTVQAQLTPQASETWLRWRLAHKDELKVFFEPWWGRFNVVTNWREMRLMEVDFSGALGPRGEGESEGAEEKVKCVYGVGQRAAAVRAAALDRAVGGRPEWRHVDERVYAALGVARYARVWEDCRRDGAGGGGGRGRGSECCVVLLEGVPRT